MAPLWAALSTANSRGAPRDHVWIAQISDALRWLAAFFNDTCGTLTRVFPVLSHFGHGGDVLICTDASPTALGGFLAINGVIVAYFSSSPSDAELGVLGHVGVCAKGQ